MKREKKTPRTEGVTGKFSETSEIFTRSVLLCMKLNTFLFGERHVFALGLAPALY